MSAPDEGRTDWLQSRTVPLRAFVRSEAASAGLLVAGVVAALAWANIDASSYDSVWSTMLSVRLGTHGITQSVQGWIDNGLMALFFLVVGLEARREFDLGDLRERRRSMLPLCAGLVGLAVPVAIYLAINLGGRGAHGWGVAMSSDTALALGALALLGHRVPERARVFLLTVLVVDDLFALIVIGVFYSSRVRLVYLVAAVAVFVLSQVARSAGLTRGPVFAVLGVLVWAAMYESGVDPVIAGLAIGLSAPAYTPRRNRLEGASDVVRLFREQPTADLAHSAVVSLTATVSPNARLQYGYRAWTSYLIVPLFALANAGVPLSGSALARAYTSPVTLGIIAGYVLGKPIAVTVTAKVVARATHGGVRAPVGWASLLGSGTIAGVGFTVSLLIAGRAFHGDLLDDAKIGALSAAVLASLLTWLVFSVVALLPARRRAAALYGDAGHVVDLVAAVDPDHDHVRGPQDATVTIVEYGDFECPFCGRAEPDLRRVLDGVEADVRFVWRHLPLVDVHPHARLAAEAAEAAGEQGAFWQMHDRLLAAQDHLTLNDLLAVGSDLGLDVERMRDELTRHVYAARVDQDLESADFSGVAGTPTFFVNGQRHHGAYDVAAMTAAVQLARIDGGAAPDEQGRPVADQTDRATTA